VLCWSPVSRFPISLTIVDLFGTRCRLANSTAVTATAAGKTEKFPTTPAANPAASSPVVKMGSPAAVPGGFASPALSAGMLGVPYQAAGLHASMGFGAPPLQGYPPAYMGSPGNAFFLSLLVVIPGLCRPPFKIWRFPRVLTCGYPSFRSFRISTCRLCLLHAGCGTRKSEWSTRQSPLTSRSAGPCGSALTCSPGPSSTSAVPAHNQRL